MIILIRFGKVTAVTDGVPYVTFGAEDTQSTRKYKRMKEHIYTVNEEVVLIVDGNKGVLIPIE